MYKRAKGARAADPDERSLVPAIRGRMRENLEMQLGWHLVQQGPLPARSSPLVTRNAVIFLSKCICILTQGMFVLPAHGGYAGG